MIIVRSKKVCQLIQFAISKSCQYSSILELYTSILHLGGIMIPQHILTDIHATQVTLNGKSHDLGHFTDIDQERLSEEFATQASAYAYVGMLVAEADAVYSDVKNDKELIYAECDAKFRDDLNRTGQKFTEAVIRGLVLLDDEYKQVLEDETQALMTLKMLKALHEAMRVKGEMLISLGATLRSEAQFTEMRINELKDQLRK